MKKTIIFGAFLLSAIFTPMMAQTEDSVKTVLAKEKTPEIRIIKGRITDASTGAPIGGAIVKASGWNRYSTLTDDAGYYEMKVPTEETSLYISCPDYNAVVLGLKEAEQQKDVVLYSSAFSKDYSEQLNILNSPSADRLQYTSAVNVKEELQAQLGAFAYGITRNGTPGVGNIFFVQGLNSLNANAQPLVVVDGVILEQQEGREMLHHGFFNDILSSINPSDIETISLLRNGTALYGARGANGVICIETKRCHSMATRITARASSGITTEPNYYSMMDAEQYRGYASELLKGTGTKKTDFKFLNTDPDYYYYNQYHNNTDWKKYVYRNAISQNYGISIEGGDDVAQYNLSVGYTANQSNLKCNDMNRLSIRFNTDIQLLKKLAVRFDVSFSNITRSIRDDGAPTTYDEGTPTAPSFLAYTKSPFISPYSYGNRVLSDSYLDVTDESYLDEALVRYSNYNYKLGNPAALNQYADAENKNHFENSLLNLAITPRYDFTPNLTLTEQFSYSLVNTNNKYYIPINGVPDYYVASVSGTRENEVRALASRQNSIQDDTRLTWKEQFGSHDVKVFGGIRANIELYSRNAQLGYNTGSDKTPFMHKSLANAQSNGLTDQWRTMDAYIQANYSYKGKYFAQANLTGTGSSRFGKDADGLKLLGTVWGIFPSIQGSWVMTNEKWMSNISFLDYLRLTAGFDVSGNDGIDNDAARSYFRSQMFLNDVSGLAFAGIGNTEIKWETTRRANAGLETNLLNNRLHVGFNYFHAVTEDLLSMQSLGFLSGLTENWANAGKLQNDGFDVSLSGKVLAHGDWNWELGASIGHYKNQIKELADGMQGYNTEFYGATIRTEVGQPANLFYGYRTEGVYSTSEQAAEKGLYILADNGVDEKHFGAGDMIFYDRDGNHEINDKDRVIIGDPNPDIYGNIFTAVSWKRLKLEMNFNYSVGNDIYNYMRSQLEGGSRFMNQTTALTQRWQAEGQETSVPKISFQDPMGNSRFSDRWIEDGSYLRLKNVTLSYDLPLNSQFIQGLQFWIQGNNLLTMTNYLGTDPECSATSSVIGQGIDPGCIGLGRSFIAGIKINL